MTRWSLNAQEATDSGSVWTGSAGARTPAGWEMGRPCHHQAPSRVANKPVINKALRSRTQARNSSMPPAYLPKKRRRCPMHSAGKVGHEHWPQRTQKSQGPVKGNPRRRQPITPCCELCILGGFPPFHVSVTNRSGFESVFKPIHSGHLVMAVTAPHADQPMFIAFVWFFPRWIPVAYSTRSRGAVPRKDH